MLLRSSSTPLLGSLLPSFHSENPSNGFPLHHQTLERATASSSCPIHAMSCRHFPISDLPDRDQSTGMRRVRSDGNIKDLRLYYPDDSQDQQRSLKSSSSCLSEEEEDQFESGFGCSDYGQNKDLDLNAEERPKRVSRPLYLARGLGIDRVGSGLLTGVHGKYPQKGEDGGEGFEIETSYKRMLEEDPTDATILRNYAQFLYQCKRELLRAEEYYSRAILADPSDADTISQYGKLVWELHRDSERASIYLERAANMDPNNCFIQAALASFLWEMCEEDDENEENNNSACKAPFLHTTLVSAGA